MLVKYNTPKTSTHTFNINIFKWRYSICHSFDFCASAKAMCTSCTNRRCWLKCLLVGSKPHGIKMGVGQAMTDVIFIYIRCHFAIQCTFSKLNPPKFHGTLNFIQYQKFNIIVFMLLSIFQRSFVFYKNNLGNNFWLQVKCGVKYFEEKTICVNQNMSEKLRVEM